MGNCLKKITKFILTLSYVFLICSCSHNNNAYKQNLSDSIEYYVSNEQDNFGDIQRNQPTFKKLDPSQMGNLSSLVNSDKAFIWLRIRFSLDEPLQKAPVGLFIGHLRNASSLFLNGNSIRKYGEMPPYENSNGFSSTFYMFPNSIINKEGINTIYIQIWPGPYGSISKNIYLSTQPYVYDHSESVSFFNSRVTITFMFVCLIISFLYFVLYFILRSYKENRMYLIYGLLNLYTAHFLLFFSAAEIPWLKPNWFSYLTILKITIIYGGFSTAYFAVSFIVSFLGYDPDKKEMRIRLGMLIATVIAGCCIPTYSLFAKALPFLAAAALLQFYFCIPRLFRALISKESRITALELLHGFSSVIITVILDFIFKVILKKEDWPLVTLYGWQITIYIFLWQLMRKFGGIYVHNTQLKDTLQNFNNNLEEVVALRTRELSEANYVLSRGLETVSHVQKNFLPPEENSFRGWDISVFYQPLDNNVSGDLYDYYTTDSTLDGLGIFDVSGHGIPAGLMTILAKGIISQHFLNGLAQEESISDILEEINATYIKEKVNVENYITGLLFHFSDFNKNDVCSVEVANAGHPYPILFNADKNTFTEIKHDNPDEQYGIIGVEGLDVSFPPVSFRMGIDDIIVCFTDGITEALNSNKEDFSKEKIIDITNQYKNETAKVIAEKIIESLKEFTNGVPFSDDITLIVLKRTDSKEYIEEI